MIDLDRSLAQKIYDREGCQWIGPEQDTYPYTKCGCKIKPMTAYCEEHHARMYIKGSATTKRRSASLLQKSNTMTVEELENLFNEAVAELEQEGVL